MLFVIDYEHDGRNGQQVQQVDADGKAHQETDEDQPAVGIRLVGLLLPFEGGPEHDRREERGHGIDLTFHGREPERIGKTVGESAHDPRAEDGEGTGFGQGPAPFFLHPAGEMDDRQIEEEDGQAGADGTHRVDRDGGILGTGEDREDARKQVEDHVTRSMTDFQLIGRGDEFAAVPEARRGFDGQEINQGSQHGYAKRNEAVDPVELFSIHSVRFFVQTTKIKVLSLTLRKI